jgi:hypothetical protein
MEDFRFYTRKFRVTLLANQKSHPWVTDFGSVPRMFRGIVAPSADIVTFLKHDALYELHITDRVEADTVLLNGLLQNEFIDNNRCILVYRVVRLGGYFYWPKTKDEISQARKAAIVERID